MEPQGPTPSQPTNELLSLLADVAEGRKMATAVQETLAVRVTKVEQIREDYRRRHRGEATDAARALEAAFQGHLEALALVGEALALPERQRLETAARSLTSTAQEVDQALRTFDWTFMTSGDTPYPLLNLLRRLRNVLAQAPAAEGQRAVAWCLPILKHAAATTRPDPRLAPLAGTFEDAVAALEAGGPEMLPEMVQACTNLENALINEPIPPTPPSSWLEALLLAGRAYDQGELPLEMVTEALEALEERLLVAWREFENASDEVGPTQEIDQTRQLFTRFHEVLEALRAALETDAELEEHLATLEQLARDLRESQRFFDEQESRAGQVPCPRCGQLNQADARVCSGCSAQMPRIGLGPIPTELPENQNLHSQNMFEIAQAAEKAATGEISAEQFTGYLRWGFDLARRGREALDALSPEDLQDDQARSLAERTREAINEIQMGLEELNSWVASGSQDYYRAGTRRILRGGQKLVSVRNAAD